MDFVKDLGLLALGSRLRRLSDRIMASGADVYRASDVDFEPRWFPVYRLLVDQGPTTVGDCARALGLTHSAVSQTARAMTKAGVVQSRRDSTDERRRLLELSEKGAALLPRLHALWADIEAAARDAAAYSGVDVLAALEGMEQALAVQSLSERVFAHQRTRMLGDVEILDFDPEYREYFRTLNLEWLEKYFVVEPVDRAVLWNPESIVEAGGAILFARVDDEIVGTCALQQDDGKWELTKMAVTESHQGRQIGRKLLLAAIERAREMGVEQLFLVTNSSLSAAVTLYRKTGFRVTQCGPHPKYERGDLTMELTLEPTP